MAKGKLEALLAEVARLRTAPLGDDTSAALRKALGDRSNHVVAKAANIVGAREIDGLEPALEEAFGRFLVDPAKSDKGCTAKSEIVGALVALNALADAVYLCGVRHVQLEPVSRTGTVDTAAVLRVRSCRGLLAMKHPAGADEVVRLLVDPVAEARIGACRALAYAGRIEAEALLRLKAHTGDPEAPVLEACFDALLALAPERSVDFVGEFLEADDPEVVESAAIALGGSRRAEAIEPLRRLAAASPSESSRRIAVEAMAMLRREEAVAALVDMVASASRAVALAAVSALAAHYREGRVAERVREAAGSRAERAVVDAVRRSFAD